MLDHSILHVRDFALQSGLVLPDAYLAYKTYGRLNKYKDNAIVFPTWFCGQHRGNEWLIGSRRALDPDKYFIIVPNMLGNGLSSSPSNMPAPLAKSGFPKTTINDNVRLQHQLVSGHFGIDHLALAIGWSMGAQQAYEWASYYPNMVARLAALCGSAKTSRHNLVFLEGVKAALTADADFNCGQYHERPLVGLRAMSRVYAGWALSQAFYREQLDISALGFPTFDAFFEGFWEQLFVNVDANDILAMLSTWQAADICNNPKYRGNLPKALASITASALVMPCRTDLYFPPEDSEIEVASMRNAELDVIPSIWGHAAGAGINPADVDYIDRAIGRLLNSSANNIRNS
ncbi:alpha/beta fold hydrolase [Rhizobium sp. 16-449-1b]|uniref:alpha/beta fold hydrolase n=1 Tax=Rhizobium sp. 16-449-1b TaxID=2819989 RepID=UPI001AD99683|nr:alpha/beta fold hydrolase [Rhizobium sp. 16-449-1b]MBO9195991.1 alpha/beta fold hydrolase [Rhizobium sp. 16-449-1b]